MRCNNSPENNWMPCLPDGALFIQLFPSQVPSALFNDASKHSDLAHRERDRCQNQLSGINRIIWSSFVFVEMRH